MMRHARIALLIVSTSIAAIASPAQAEGLRAASRDGYGRLVFDWDSPVRYSAEVVGNQLVLQFDRPIAGNVPAADQALTDYVAGPGKLGADGRSLTYVLRANVTMRPFAVGILVARSQLSHIKAR